jgi:hypothetical protein
VHDPGGHRRPFSSEDSLIFPVPGHDVDSVILEPRDGSNVQRTFCNEIKVSGGPRDEQILRAASIRAQVLITDARLTVACSNYDNGGGWLGSPGLMLALNAGSKLPSARRRRGKMLVGQIRYPWIRAVYAQNKAGWSGIEMLRVFVKARDEVYWLDLTFPRDVDATAVGTELIRRAARFRLAYEPDLNGVERAKMEELANVGPLAWRRNEKKMAGHKFPCHWRAAPRSARFGLSHTGG